ncbi:hypothetical protein SKAU_G00320460 [Synaphobranchus kaupii]|uniref:CCHC-type domain-containing protein n=1 Tax=Synaphobranchus kaupii TaxID=118154 RepID=A0A9Q1IHK2_SYNKA|nr:hypothetical protein SKAU_G00320460 [Synaphobranchus kaupii]
MINDALDIWTGKRQFRVVLKEDLEGYDGYLHPPASFTIGADRGYLIYAGQPRFCRKCNRHGHTAETCTLQRCRNCEDLGHATKDCTEPKRCSICGSENHLYRRCPKTALSYASAVRRDKMAAGREAPLPPLRDIELVVEELAQEMRACGKDCEEPGGQKTDPAPVSSKQNSWADCVENQTPSDSAGEKIKLTSEWTTPTGRKKRTRKRKFISSSNSPAPHTAADANPFGLLLQDLTAEEESGTSDMETVPDPKKETVAPPPPSSVQRQLRLTAQRCPCFATKRSIRRRLNGKAFSTI